MKTAFQIFLFLLYAFYFAAAFPDPVRDLSQKKLSTGVQYYILPFSAGSSSGGITLASTRNKTCPLDVAQDLKAYSHGLGVTFLPLNFKEGVTGRRFIYLSTHLTIKFSTAKACVGSTIWKMDKYDSLRQRYFVTVGGEQGKQGSDSFRIEKEKENYKIVYCTQVRCVTKRCNPVCHNIGVYHEQGEVLLTFADEPLVVMFRKVFRG